MSINQDTIDQLYPDCTGVMEDTPVTTEATPPTDDHGYKPEPEKTEGNPYSLDEGSLEDTLYGGESKVSLNDETDLSIIYQSEEEQAALRENLGYMASETGATQDDIHSLVSYANKQLITGELADPQESLSTLYEQHGTDLNSKLADAQELVKTIPELSAWLDQTRLGDDPVMINQIIRIAQSPRSQARLQKLRSTK